MNQSHRPLQLFIGILALSLLSIGCDIDSADSTSRSVSINVGGVYRGDPIISQNSGAAIETLNVIQNGSGLQAVDNNGLIFRGNISTEFENGANFTLKGRTTAGQEGLITGTFTVSGTTSTMRGTWAEPNYFGNVSATADGVEGSTTSLRVEPSGSIRLAVGISREFIASGGSSSYSWSMSTPALGDLSATSGATVRYTADGVGTNRLTVASGGESVTVEIIQE
jgi:hypothetical protein